jgi:hypothetical protein
MRVMRGISPHLKTRPETTLPGPENITVTRLKPGRLKLIVSRIPELGSRVSMLIES